MYTYIYSFSGTTFDNHKRLGMHSRAMFAGALLWLELQNRPLSSEPPGP